MVKNLVEELVIGIVDHLYTPEVLHNKGLIADNHSKEDIICYILNRIEPKYANSMRGTNYFHKNTNFMDKGDYVSLFFEALNKINRRKRNAQKESTTVRTSYCFVFPQFHGKVYNGDTLEKLSGVKISFYLNNELVKSNQSFFENPYTIHKNTAGHYSFWSNVLPVEDKIEREFTFKIVFDHATKDSQQLFKQLKIQSRLQEDHKKISIDQIELDPVYL